MRTSIAFRAKTPNLAGFRQMAKEIEREHNKAALVVTDMASKRAQRRTQAKIRTVGLGNLANAVGQSSALKKRQRDPGRAPYGVIFARGGDLSRGGGALEAYSRGTVIYPKRGAWLAAPTDAAQRFVNIGGRRRRLTPALWVKSGMNSRVGVLKFRKVKPNLAMLYVRRVSLSAKTGRAKAIGKRSPRTRVIPDRRDVVIFWLFKVTRRAQRFNHHDIVRFEANRMPDYLYRTLRGLNTAAR